MRTRQEIDWDGTFLNLILSIVDQSTFIGQLKDLAELSDLVYDKHDTSYNKLYIAIERKVRAIRRLPILETSGRLIDDKLPRVFDKDRFPSRKVR